jgi:antirestriction protein ArdC
MAGKTENRQAKKDHYKEVTEKMISIMEEGRKPWEKPWNGDAAFTFSVPRNAVTGKRYRGVNTLILMSHELTTASHGDPRWATFKQAESKGWKVKKGSKAENVLFYRQIVIGEQSEDGEQKTMPLLKSFPVFHASCLDGIPEWTPDIARQPWATLDAADVIMKNSGADLRVGKIAAYYPSTDHIDMPPKDTFRTAEGYAAVGLHELGHWTGAKQRLDRELTGYNSNQESYAKEELRAELASAFICAELGISSDLENHASYLSAWLETLKNDNREIFRAARDAQRIAEYCLAFHPEYVAENKAEAAASADAEPTEIEETASLKMAG